MNGGIGDAAPTTSNGRQLVSLTFSAASNVGVASSDAGMKRTRKSAGGVLCGDVRSGDLRLLKNPNGLCIPRKTARPSRHAVDAQGVTAPHGYCTKH